MANSCTCGANGEQSKKKVSKRPSSSKKSGEKNPYSDRGIDKFSALLAELEEKKRMIYSHLNPEEVSMIRFVQTADNKLKPVVLTAGNKASKFKEVTHEVKAEEEKKPVSEDEIQTDKEEIEIGDVEMEMKFPSFQIQPWYYMLGGMVILVLLLMAMFGRYWKTIYLLQLQAAFCPKL